MTDNHDPKPMPDRDTVLRAIRAHIGDGCNLNTDQDQKEWCEWCPYYSFDVHDPPCEMRLFWDIYDLLSPKPVSNIKYDGLYFYGSCPSCGRALHHNSIASQTLLFCPRCGTALQWNNCVKIP